MGIRRRLSPVTIAALTLVNHLSRMARGFISLVRDPTWLTLQRVAFYSGALLLLYLSAAIGQLLNAHHLIFQSGQCVGGDFVDYYAASVAALRGDATSVYNVHLQHIMEASVMGGRDFGVLVFSYPPTNLLMVLPLSLLPFASSWVLFEAVTLAGYLVVLRRIAPSLLGLWLTITFPGVIINFMCGQNGYLTTALIGGGLLLLDQRPVLAGILFGLMAYKPHLAILIPLALIIARQWRAFVAAAASTILFAATSLAVFGLSAWRAFVGNLAITQRIVLDQGGINFATLQSIFGAVRMWGGSIQVAYIAQALVALYAAVALFWVWRSMSTFALKAATLTVGCLMVTPYLLQYDLVLLALPIAWLAMEGVTTGFLPYEKTVLLAAWILPRISLPIAVDTGIPIAPMVIVVLLTTILRRVSREASIAQHPQALTFEYLETPV